MADERSLPRIGGWIVEGELGRGGMGVVYVAVSATSGERRALKIIRSNGADASPEAVALFEREVRIGMQLQHPHIVRLHEVGQEEGLCYLVMELCDAGSLADRVTAEGPMSAAEALPLFLDVLDGLSYAHAVGGTVHRDIKPQNVLLTGRPAGGQVVKIADFGLAKAYETAGLSGMTRTGTVAGSPAFMPRAQLADYKYAKPHVDVWSTAASLYYVLTGHTPRDFPPGRDPWLTVATSAVVPVVDRGVEIPKRLAAVVDRALSDDPGKGFLTADSLCEALHGV
ncbi:serine/threonine-protein kinase [Streptomyces sp. XY332]|uniref:serine/threonine-protein kinase n=1 Tax=Streptomyces sp. XY332 TaxID=1415561 RepID=UPI0006B1AC80|nr:serine/threonine-protein kinase [Streptomyces sp. XY332]